MPGLCSRLYSGYSCMSSFMHSAMRPMPSCTYPPKQNTGVVRTRQISSSNVSFRAVLFRRGLCMSFRFYGSQDSHRAATGTRDKVVTLLRVWVLPGFCRTRSFRSARRQGTGRGKWYLVSGMLIGKNAKVSSHFPMLVLTIGRLKIRVLGVGLASGKSLILPLSRIDGNGSALSHPARSAAKTAAVQ